MNTAILEALEQELVLNNRIQVARSVAISSATTAVLMKTQSEFPETNLSDVVAGIAEEVASAIDAMNPSTDADYVVAGKFVAQQFCNSVAKKARDLRHG